MKRITLITLLLSVVVSSAMAETLRDPTQLPVEFALPTASTGEVMHTSTSGPVLQSIILSDDMRAAIISGHRIDIGDKYQDARLVALTENSATLQQPDGEKTILKMPHIGIKKTEKNTVPDLVSPARMATKSFQVR